MTKPNNILHKQRSSKAKPNQFGVSVRRAGRLNLVSEVTRPTPILTGDDIAQGEEPEILPAIQGQKPGSRYEWRLAVALQNAGLAFDFQVSIMGGRSMRGGQVIDFVVHTLPLSTPVFADGEHWHDSALAKEDVIKRLFLEATFGKSMNPPVTFFGPDLHTLAAARAAVRKVFKQ